MFKCNNCLYMIRIFLYCYNWLLSQPAMLLLTDDTRGSVTVSWEKEHQEWKRILLTIPVLCTHLLLTLAIFLLILLISYPFITMSTYLAFNIISITIISIIFWPCRNKDIILWMHRKKSNVIQKAKVGHLNHYSLLGDCKRKFTAVTKLVPYSQESY